MEENKGRKPFKTRLVGSIIIWLIIAFIIGNIGFFVWLLPQRSEFELRGGKLPPLSDLTLVEGKITNAGYYTSQRRQFARPTIEFQVEGKNYQFQTVDSYAHSVRIFEANEKVEVLFITQEPEKAWLKWEYERMMANYESFFILRFGESIKQFYFYFLSVILSISGLILLINLFFPILRFLPINK